jgi:transposase-like protein
MIGDDITVAVLGVKGNEVRGFWCSCGHSRRSESVEQDHRAIKRRCASMAGFKSFASAVITVAGIELAHRIRKRQFSFGASRPRRVRSLKVLWDRALALGHSS